MVAIKDAVVWVNWNPRDVMVRPHAWGCPEERARWKDQHWGDPIGAADVEWGVLTNEERIRLMLETAIELATQGFAMKAIVSAFAQVDEFYALGRQSYPMCRALTAVIVGRPLEFGYMSFDELLIHYEPSDEPEPDLRL